MDEAEMIENDILLHVDGVWKSYQSGAFRAQTLMGEIRGLVSKIFCKERAINDPIGLEEFRKLDSPESKKFWALRDVTFSVKRGEFIVLLGRNGSGKTTLFKIISQITNQDKGYIYTRGKLIALLGAGVGFNAEMSGRENIYLNGSILGMTHLEIDEKFNQIVEFAEISSFIETPVKRYSSGMIARLGFAIAIHVEADLFIFDEILAVGDQPFMEKCKARIKELTDGGKTIVLVTHRLRRVKKLCSRSIVFENGRLIYDGNPEEAESRYLDK
jgi:lipopolysaccharide transport system ATP-binding protein